MKTLILGSMLFLIASFLQAMDYRTSDKSNNFDDTYDQLVKDDFFETFKKQFQNGIDTANYLKLVEELFNYSKIKFNVDLIINANNISAIDDNWVDIKKKIRLNCAEGEELKKAFIHLKQLGEPILGTMLQRSESNPVITELGRRQNDIQKFITKLEHVNSKLKCDTKSSSTSDGLWGKFKSLF